MKIGKVWGWTEEILATPFVAIHRLHVEPHARCSLHRHARRWNAFLIIAGHLTVEVEQETYPLVDVTILAPGEATLVPPGLFHRFLTAAESVECWELYFPPDLQAADIERRDFGWAKWPPGGWAHRPVLDPPRFP